MGEGSALISLVSNLFVLSGPMISLGYPLYASIWAIETKSPVGTQQWLTYWVLYSMIAIFELTFSVIIQWIPFWSFAKLITYCWLVLPYFSGASYVYGRFVRPMFVKGEIVDILRNASWEKMNIVDVLKNAWEKINTSNIWRNAWKKTSASNKGDDILTAAYRQMKKENGKS